MSLQRLIQVQTGQALHIKAGEPHGTDKDDAQRVILVLKLFVQLPLFHLCPVRLDVQIPFFESLNFIQASILNEKIAIKPAQTMIFLRNTFDIATARCHSLNSGLHLFLYFSHNLSHS